MTTAHGVMSNGDLALIAMLARGYTTSLAARELHLSRHTVGERISVLLERFNCKNRAELVAYCYVHGHLSTLVWPPCRGQCALSTDNDQYPASCPQQHGDGFCESANNRNGSQGGG